MQKQIIFNRDLKVYILPFIYWFVIFHFAIWSLSVSSHHSDTDEEGEAIFWSSRCFAILCAKWKNNGRYFCATDLCLCYCVVISAYLTADGWYSTRGFNEIFMDKKTRHQWWAWHFCPQVTVIAVFVWAPQYLWQCDSTLTTCRFSFHLNDTVRWSVKNVTGFKLVLYHFPPFFP